MSITKGEHKVGYYYYYLAAGDEQRADGLVPPHSHLTNTVLTDCFFAIVINGCKFLSLFRSGCVSAARQPYRKVSIHTCLVRQILLLARHVTLEALIDPDLQLLDAAL